MRLLRQRLFYRHQAGLPAQAGWTLAELLIVVAILVVLALLILLAMRSNIDKGFDAKRKADLEELRISLEDYYNDKECYAPEGSFDNCASPDVGRCMRAVVCDPRSKDPYLYVPQTNPCTGYVACASLRNKGDPDIEKLGCDPVEGCGWGAGYNYCISSGISVVAPGFVPNAGETPTPTPTPGGGGYLGTYACTPGGQCNIYADPPASGCPQSYAEPTCNNECGDPANRCAN